MQVQYVREIHDYNVTLANQLLMELGQFRYAEPDDGKEVDDDDGPD